MIGEGEPAPAFRLPAFVDREFGEVALNEYLGDDIVILAFYPSDFNPACSEESTDLDELDLFTMQKDVSILGISTDSIHSHRAFAQQYDLHIPLLADVGGEVASDYGVTVEDPEAGYLTKRAIVVVGLAGLVEYAWQAEDISELPNVDEVREAVDEIGGDAAAEGRYRVGHAHYVEGRRAFTSAMHSFEEDEWMMAESDFTQAYEEFDEAADHFDTAVTFAEDQESRTYFKRAEEKAHTLWQAAEWLAQSASAFASGEGTEGESLRRDAERPLENASEIHEPPDPDEFPPEVDPATRDDDERESILPTQEPEEAPTLELDVEESEPEEPDSDDTADGTGDGVTTESATAVEETAGDQTEPTDETETGGSDTTDRTTAAETETTADDEDEDDEIDEAELEEITAQLEEQTKNAQKRQENEPDDDDGALIEAPDEEDLAKLDEDEGRASERSDVDGETRPEDEQPELDLTDPNEGTEQDEEDDDEDDDEESTTDETGNADVADDLGGGGGGHGVPDSL